MSISRTVLPKFFGGAFYIESVKRSALVALCALLLPLALGACDASPEPRVSNINPNNSTSSSPSTGPEIAGITAPAPPGSADRPLEPGQSGQQYLPNGMPAIMPPRGVNADTLFAEKITDTDERFRRLENAVVDLRREFDAVMPAIVRLTAVEQDMQDLLKQLQTLTGAAPGDASASDLDSAPVQTVTSDALPAPALPPIAAPATPEPITAPQAQPSAPIPTHPVEEAQQAPKPPERPPERVAESPPPPEPAIQQPAVRAPPDGRAPPPPPMTPQEERAITGVPAPPSPEVAQKVPVKGPSEPVQEPEKPVQATPEALLAEPSDTPMPRPVLPTTPPPAPQAVATPQAEKPKSIPGTPTVSAIRTGEQAGGVVRIVLDLTGPSPHHSDLDNEEHLLLVEMPKAGWSAKPHGDFASSPLLKSWTTEALKDGTGTRLVIQLQRGVKVVSDTSLSDPSRIVLDLKPE